MTQMTIDAFEDDGFELPYYDASKLQLTGSMRSKARRIVRDEYIEKHGPGEWVILPIPGYNVTPRVVTYSNGVFTCNCQYARTHPVCAHILAVLIFEGRIRDAKLEQWRAKHACGQSA